MYHMIHHSFVPVNGSPNYVEFFPRRYVGSI
jgi:hypothetical protein